MATLKSFDLNGKKLSFANWISNISPSDCLFTSMINSEKVDQVLFQWQLDALKEAKQNSYKEGSKSEIVADKRPTTIFSNRTQILRKVICVSDTANATDAYGRSKELSYQMEKAARELNRDIEWSFLNNVGSENVLTSCRTTSGFRGLVAPRDVACSDTGAVVNKGVDGLKEEYLFDLTYNLYMAGSDANIIMFHPKHAAFFSGLQETSTRSRLFENTDSVDLHVSSITDPMGVEYKLIPNRMMPREFIYFFNPDDFTKMILREPRREKLAKTGSSEKWMLEVETGLRLRNPCAAGMLQVEATVDSAIFKTKGGSDTDSPTIEFLNNKDGGLVKHVLGKTTNSTNSVVAKEHTPIKATYYLKTDAIADRGIQIKVVLLRNNTIIGSKDHTSNVTGTTKHIIAGVDSSTVSDAGVYHLHAFKHDPKSSVYSGVDVTSGVAISIGKYPAI